MAKKILIVDDDKDLVESLSQVLQSRGYETAAAYSAAEGLKTLLAEKPDLGIASAMLASPITCTLACSVDAKVRRSTGHQPLLSAKPSVIAIWPAFMAGRH